MKLKEKLASDWCNKDELTECARDDLPFIYDEAYIAGFEKARDEAAKLVSAYLNEDGKIVYDILRMGEEEIE